MLSSSDVVTDRGGGETVPHNFRSDNAIGPKLRVQRAAAVDAEHIQVRVRGVLTAVGRGARNAPHCDDVGHLPAHPGNYVCPRALISCSQLL